MPPRSGGMLEAQARIGAADVSRSHNITKAAQAPIGAADAGRSHNITTAAQARIGAADAGRGRPRQRCCP